MATSLRSYFDGSDIAVNVIGYRPDPAEQDQVRAQFEAVKQFRIPGSDSRPPGCRELIAALDRAMRPALRYALTTGENRPVLHAPAGFRCAARRSRLAGRTPRSSRPALSTPPPNGQRAILPLPRQRWRLAARQDYEPADRPRFERELYSERGLRTAAAREDKLSGWRLSAIQNQLVELLEGADDGDVRKTF